MVVNSDKQKWPETSWDKVVDMAERVTLQIRASNSLGTCFAVSVGKKTKLQGAHYIFATAWHVVKSVADSKLPICMMSANGEISFKAPSGYYQIIRLGSEVFDTALVYLWTSEEIVPQEHLLPMLDWNMMMPKGAELGWVGFPALSNSGLCFFCGTISGHVNSPPTYLVDGVAINGVSGGPALDNRAHIIGLVSSYIPNRVDKYTTLPGLLALVPINAIRYYMEHKLKASVIYQGPKEV
jgi:hypothetical protein